MNRIKPILTIVLCTVFVASVYANLSGTFKTITVDGDLADWSNPDDILYSTDEVTVGVPVNSSIENVYMANNAEDLFIGLDMKGANAGQITNAWTWNIYIDTDMDASTGFNAGWMTHGYDYLIQYGNGGNLYSVHSFSGAKQSEWTWYYLSTLYPYAYSGDVVELSVPLYLLDVSTNSIVVEFSVAGTGITTESWAAKFESDAETYTLAVPKPGTLKTGKKKE